jgi:hypothetical protein
VTERWQHSTHDSASRVQCYDSNSWRIFRYGASENVSVLTSSAWTVNRTQGRAMGILGLMYFGNVIELLPSTFIYIKLIPTVSFHLLPWQLRWQFSESFTTKIVITFLLPQSQPTAVFPILPHHTKLSLSKMFSTSTEFGSRRAYRSSWRNVSWSFAIPLGKYLTLGQAKSLSMQRSLLYFHLIRP